MSQSPSSQNDSPQHEKPHNGFLDIISFKKNIDQRPAAPRPRIMRGLNATAFHHHIQILSPSLPLSLFLSLFPSLSPSLILSLPLSFPEENPGQPASPEFWIQRLFTRCTGTRNQGFKRLWFRSQGSGDSEKRKSEATTPLSYRSTCIPLKEDASRGDSSPADDSPPSLASSSTPPPPAPTLASSRTSSGSIVGSRIDLDSFLAGNSSLVVKKLSGAGTATA
jgi:hypothetical protein